MIKYKPLEQNLEEGLGGLGKQIRGMPHIIIGSSKPEHPPISSPPVKPLPVVDPKLPTRPNETPFFEKVKNWALILCVLAVIGYGIYQIFT